MSQLSIRSQIASAIHLIVQLSRMRDGTRRYTTCTNGGPLFIYVKNAHKGVIPGLAEFVTEYVSEASFGEGGYLSERGLIPLPTEQRDATRAAFALADHPGIFSRLAGALALVGANVVDAKTYTSKDGYATPVFWIQDAEGKPYDVERLPRLTQMIDKTLKGEVVAREALAGRDKVKKREREFRFPTHITFDNEGSEIYTIIEVDTRDRPGLLYDLTRTLAASNIYIASAVIATYGAQVVDTFYVKDMFGLKLHQKHRQEALEKKLRQAIVEGAERAIA